MIGKLFYIYAMNIDTSVFTSDFKQYRLHCDFVGLSYLMKNHKQLKCVQAADATHVHIGII